MTATTQPGNWVPIVAWTQVCLGLAGLLALVAPPVTAVAVAAVATLIGLVCRAFARASRKLDRIMAEELDR